MKTQIENLIIKRNDKVTRTYNVSGFLTIQDIIAMLNRIGGFIHFDKTKEQRFTNAKLCISVLLDKDNLVIEQLH